MTVRPLPPATADAIAHALLDIALLHRHEDGFDRAWVHWQEVLKGPEDDRP
ncbi:hypothetical protein [Kineococcus indalonis]|uniref:hypothetical protein n=1 Tax=Kineococcus indalonis TaxID=2696566 RepID=UPI001411F017|nr:hypothetical protein [Kineococcus indalonis]NAZ88250.1 hypothetical protein [Kineococcus indalonis]